MSEFIHLVRAGETLSSIAERYQTSVNALMQTNNLRQPNLLRIGQLLKVAAQVDSAHFLEKAKRSKRTSTGSTSPGRSSLVQKLKLVAPQQRGTSRSIACCGWAVVQVELYLPPATTEDKQKTRWALRDSKTRAPLLNPGREQADLLVIDSFPDAWEGRTVDVHAYLKSISDNVKLPLTIETSGEVGRFIKLVRKLENTLPSWSGEKVLNALRRLAGYDNQNFRAMYGGLPQADELKPAGALSQSDLDELKRMTLHTFRGATELGVARDALGEDVALGHVLTGISAGQHRHTAIDLTPAWSMAAGETMDNLYATTIAGDLGQTAVLVHYGRSSNYVGPGSDATAAELVGDIDGFLIGSNIDLYTGGRSLSQPGEQGAKLSELLHNYYCISGRLGVVPNTATDRFARFSLQSRTALLDQTQRFAVNYVYATEGKWTGIWSGASGDNTTRSVNAFYSWLETKVKEERARGMLGRGNPSNGP